MVKLEGKLKKCDLVWNKMELTLKADTISSQSAAKWGHGEETQPDLTSSSWPP